MNLNDFCVINNIQELRDEFGINDNFKNWVQQNFTPKFTYL